MSAFPNFNDWHKVPTDATIPARTPFFGGYRGMVYEYHPTGLYGPASPFVRDESRDYYTEERIPSPGDEAVEKRARDMYYSMPDSTEWEYEPLDIQEAWLNLARKYVEK